MIRTHCTIAFKYLRSHPSYSLLSILGFSLALAGTFLLLSHLLYQRDFDKHVSTWDRVYRLSGEINLPANENIHGCLGPRLGPVMKEEMAAVEEMTRLVPFEEECILGREGIRHFEDQVYYADPSVFRVFPLDFLQGDPERSLVSSGQMVISESVARKYFDRTDVVGEQLTLNQNMVFEISGVTRDLPANVHHKMHILISMATFRPEMQAMIQGNDSENYWRPFAFHFLLLKKQNTAADVEAAFPAFYKEHMAEFGEALQASFRLIVTPLPELHFTPEYAYDMPKGSRDYEGLLILAGTFLMLIALLNYSNLLAASLAQRQESLERFRTTGASRKQILSLLFTESLLLMGASMLAAYLLVGLARTRVGAWFGASPLPAESGQGLLLLVSGLLLLAFLAAFVLPVSTRMGRKPGLTLAGLGKSSVVIQFGFSVFLVISSLLITRQVRFLLDGDMGYRTDAVLQIRLHAEDAPLEKILTLKQELNGLAAVEQVAYCTNIPGEPLATAHFKMDADGLEASKIVSLVGIDADYLPLMDMELKEGRNFHPGGPAAQEGILVNEACIDFLGMGESLSGQRIRDIEILGVVKNARYNSFREEARPIAFYCNTEKRGYLIARLQSADLRESLRAVEAVYGEVFPDRPFEATFLDETVASMYRDDILQNRLLVLFTLLSITIANTGLFGLVALLHRRRRKEVGIRKANGATTTHIVLLLIRQVFVWIFLAACGAVPLSWYLSGRWLQNFTQRTDFSFSLVLWGILLTLGTALITTGFITLQAARRNPVDTLRHE
ncbi:MAG: FtsX-like permease family protein [Bacteroidales bacterium]